MYKCEYNYVRTRVKDLLHCIYTVQPTYRAIAKASQHGTEPPSIFVHPFSKHKTCPFYDRALSLMDAIAVLTLLHYSSSAHSRLPLRVSACSTSVVMALFVFSIGLVAVDMVGHEPARVCHPLSFHLGHFSAPPPLDTVQQKKVLHGAFLQP